jgi:hypothetical protein
MIAPSSNAMFSPTRSRSPSCHHSPPDSPRSLVRQICVQKGRANAIPSCDDHTRLRQWVGIPWSEFMSESLRLSQFPIPPHHANPKPSKTTLAGNPDLDEGDCNDSTEQVRADEHNRIYGTTGLSLPARNIQIRVQQPTSIISPRPSTSIRHGFRENTHPAKDDTVEEVRDEGAEENPRRSVHLARCYRGISSLMRQICLHHHAHIYNVLYLIRVVLLRSGLNLLDRSARLPA